MSRTGSVTQLRSLWPGRAHTAERTQLCEWGADFREEGCGSGDMSKPRYEFQNTLYLFVDLPIYFWLGQVFVVAPGPFAVVHGLLLSCGVQAQQLWRLGLVASWHVGVLVP